MKRNDIHLWLEKIRAEFQALQINARLKGRSTISWLSAIDDMYLQSILYRQIYFFILAPRYRMLPPIRLKEKPGRVDTCGTSSCFNNLETVPSLSPEYASSAASLSGSR